MMTYDCIWARDELRHAKQHIYEYALEPLQKYREVIATRVWHTFLELENIVDDIEAVSSNVLEAMFVHAQQSKVQVIRTVLR